MKKLLSSFKTFDYKAFAVEHGEKIALGTVGFVVLLALVVGTQWSRFDGRPSELVEKVDTAGKRIANAAWPEEERLGFVASTVGPAAPKVRVESMLAGVPGGTAEFSFGSGPLIWPLQPKTDVFSEPRWERLEEPIADPGRITLDVARKTEVVVAEPARASQAAELLDTRVEANPFAKRDGGQAAPGTGLLTGEFADIELAGNGFDPDDGESVEDGDGTDLRSSGGSVASTSTPNGLPTHYVSVRMLFPARRQLNEILKSRGQVATTDPSSLLEIFDFEIQRSQAIAGPRKWSDWEAYDLTSVIELLQRVTDFEEEFISPNAIEPTITMPLPMPKYGYYGPNAEHATHPNPKIKRLTDDYRALLSKVAANAALLQRQQRLSDGLVPFGDENEAEAEEQQRGWNRVSQSLGDVLSPVLEDRSNYETLLAGVNHEAGVSVLEQINQNRLAAMGEYLLFRFVDFDVESGRAYRYRARLILRNPNYGLPLDRVSLPEVAEGAIRETEWSDPTNPVVIEPDVEFFVVDVDRGTSYKEPTALFDLNVWSDRLGTWVSENVRVTPGERVGGSEPVKTKVANLVNDTLDEKLIRFETDEVLADLMLPPKLEQQDASFHGKYLDVQIPRLGFEVTPPTIILDEFGELVTFDSGERRQRQTKVSNRYRLQMSQLEGDLGSEKDADTGGDRLDDGLDDEGVDDGEGDGDRKERSRRRRRQPQGNPLRIGN